MRLITRLDFDGLACGVLLKELNIVDTYIFVHPKDMQDGIIQVTENDVIANVPYVPGCGLWFDHHSSEDERIKLKAFKGVSRHELSAARVIYDYYGGKSKLGRFSSMVSYVDKVDSAFLTIDEIMNPKKWILLGFLMDPRTGLGRVKEFRINNATLMEELIEHCRNLTIDEILELTDIKERIAYYNTSNEHFKEMITKYTRTDKNVIVTDLRGLDEIRTGNRFIIYSMYPKQNISCGIIDGKDKQNCVISVGHSIINGTSGTDVGSLMLKYGGGGHKAVGTCQVPYGDADRVINEIIHKLKIDG